MTVLCFELNTSELEYELSGECNASEYYLKTPILHTPVDLPDYDVDGGSIAFAGSVLHVSKI